MILELPLIEKRQEASGVITLRFDTRNTGFDYVAGQHASMTLDVSDPKGNMRQFSIASSPTEKDFVMFSTKLSDTPFKQKLNSLILGDKVKVKGPFGNFILPSDYSKQIIMLSGGIGITPPPRSMIKFATDKRLDSKIILLYSNRIPKDILYRKDLEEMEKNNRSLRAVFTITRPEESDEEWSGRTGRIDEKTIRETVKDAENSVYYVCGPPGMVDALYSLLKSMNVSEENIHMEEFLGYT